MTNSKMYRGRFAPSPTGPLHFGSLVAAVASYCQAKSLSGEWLLRIEDLDAPREISGASDSIIRTLAAFGFYWDSVITYQKNRHEYYATALKQLAEQQLIYPCTCSRKQIATQHAGVYPGTCRSASFHDNLVSSWRINTLSRSIHFSDAIQGNISTRLDLIGDYVLKRADGVYSYQLAVAVDDALQGITEVVRGYDLLDSTSRQIYIQQQLNYSSPQYAHHPIVIDSTGNKLSKQTFAPAIKQTDAQKQLFLALQFLGQMPPDELQFESIQTIWHWAIEHWSLNKIPKCKSIV